MKGYGHLWRVLSTVFRVPSAPPRLPAFDGKDVETFRPAPGFLGYLRFWFWVAFLLIDGALLALWITALVINPWAGLALFPVFLVVAVVPDVVAWVAIRLRFDTTWYVVSDRSLRIRRGIVVLRETTITFENVQNVKIKQGPLERRFGIAHLIVETAGGGGSGDDQEVGAHTGLLEGVSDARRIRDLILDRARASGGAGLGDEEPELSPWTPEHVALLRSIRDEVDALAGGAP